MSYILDALKKSDLQRKKEHVPDLNTVQLGLPASERKKVLWPYLLGGVLLLNGLFFLYFIMRQDQPSTEFQAVVQNSDPHQVVTVQVQEKQTAIEPQSMQPLSSVTQEPPPMDLVATVDNNRVASKGESDTVSSQESSIATVVDNESDTEKAENKIISATNIAREQVEVGVKSVLESVTEDTYKEAAKETAPEPANIIVPEKDFAIVTEPEIVEAASLFQEQPERPAKNKLQQPLLASPTTSTQIAEESRSSLHLRQLPLSLRQKLPEIHIGAHVFFKNKPSSRLASINGKLMREGDTLAPDLKVAEITPDGVVFSYQKYFFHVPVF